MAFLSAGERRTLEMVCDTLLPALRTDAPGAEAAGGGVTGSSLAEDPRLFGLGAADLGLAGEVEATLETLSNEEERRQVRLVLRALDSGLVNGLGAGAWGKFADLDLARRTAVLRSWANSDLSLARAAFQTFKRVAGFLFYSLTPGGRPNPTWQALGFGAIPSPLPAARPPAIQPLEIHAPTSLETDVLIIGSGAGGGVAAGELAAAGYDVIVVEKGGYYSERNYDGGERRGLELLYEKRGALTSSDQAVQLLAGSTLGGGTVVNWNTSLVTPPGVLAEWAHEYGFAAAEGPEFARSLEAVSRRINANTAESQANPQNEALAGAAQALGYRYRTIPRNVHGCVDCSLCQFGCRYSAKQSTLATYLQDACEHGARILVHAEAERIEYSHGIATGATVIVTAADGVRYPVLVKARIVVVSAGAIHTPALLLRSGLRNPNIGQHLHIHPVTVAMGRYDAEMCMWQGAPQSRLVDELADLDGQGYGVRIETAPAPPGISGMLTTWESGRSHRERMAGLSHLANFIVLDRDRFGGRVRANRYGRPVIDYRLHAYDSRHLMEGLVAALRLHLAAGAVEAVTLHNRTLSYVRADGGDFEGFLRDVRAAGLPANRVALLSAHQMSSCRIAGDARRGALDPTGQTYEVKRLYVADGSVLPTPSGVNPMITIMGLAHYIAQQIKTQF